MSDEIFSELLQILNTKKELNLNSWWDLHPRILQFVQDKESNSVGYYKSANANNCFYLILKRPTMAQIILFDDELEKEYWINLRSGMGGCRLEQFVEALTKK